MKKITHTFGLIFIIGFCVISTTNAQQADFYCPMHEIEEPVEILNQMSACNPATDICVGKYKPGKGTLKMLMVYIRFADDHSSMSYWNTYPNTSNIYDTETWMAESIDATTYVNSDNYFNLSNYFSEVSRDSLEVIGDAVYIELPPKSTFTDDGTPLEGLALMQATNEYALEYLDNNSQIDLSDYDNFDYISTYHHKESPDNILDMGYTGLRKPIILKGLNILHFQV